MPIAWMCLFLNRPEHQRRPKWIALCLLLISTLMSVMTFRFDPFRNAPSILRILVSPFLHADYLHLCLNVFGGFLVLNRLEEVVGSRRFLLVIVLALTTHISLMSILFIIRRAPLEVLGLSWTVFTALGYLVLLRFSIYTMAQKISIVVVLLLMILIEVSTQTIVVHCLAVLFGAALSRFRLRSLAV
jgi:membrane associated rhomboid family serine protease